MTEFLGKASPLVDRAFRAVNEALGGNACSLWTLLAAGTRGFGFLPDRRQKIAFERHVFHRLTGGRFDADAGTSAPAPGGHVGGAAEYQRLASAAALDGSAALESVSWGLGRILGADARALGYADAADMAVRFSDSEGAQLDGILRVITRNPAFESAFRARDWQAVAAHLDGETGASKELGSKLQHCFERFTREGLPSLDVRAAQARLVYLGFDPKGIDGVLGAHTRSALTRFQQAHGIPATSGLDSRTADELVTATGV